MMMVFKSERLDRLISIERATTAKDTFNADIETWAPLLTDWASYRRASARERVAGAELDASFDSVFEIRWSSLASSIDPRDRIIFEDREYQITGVFEIGRRVGIRLEATARSETPA